MAIQNGNKVQVHYTGTLDDGTVFDSSEKHGQPLSFEVGAHQVIPGFEDAVLGMDVGQEKTIALPPAKAYGEVNPELVKKIPKEHVPNNDQAKKDMVLMLSTPDGQQFPARVVDVDDKEIILDINHPLAGKTLNFKIKITAVE